MRCFLKKILYIARAGLPIDAAGIRMEQIGNLFERLDYKIHYICNMRVNKAVENSGYQLIEADDYLNSYEKHYCNGKKIYSYLPKIKNSKYNSAKEIIEIFTAANVYKRVVDYCEKEKPNIIILYNDAYSLTKKLTTYCKKNNIKIIADITEWYEKRKDAKIGERSINYLTDRRIQSLDFKLDGAIVISKFFEEYYKKRNLKCIWIPPLMEIKCQNCIKKFNYDNFENIINFVYAGAPGSKDNISNFVEAIVKVNKLNVKCRLDIIGVDESYFNYMNISNLKEYGVYAHGRLTHEKTIEYVYHADFGILFRENKRYAKAGFSTKFSECMSLGVPMICNSVGGTDVMIENGKNGILISDYEVSTLVDTINHIIKFDISKIEMMKYSALEYADNYLNIDKYIESIENII